MAISDMHVVVASKDVNQSDDIDEAALEAAQRYAVVEGVSLTGPGRYLIGETNLDGSHTKHEYIFPTDRRIPA